MTILRLQGNLQTILPKAQTNTFATLFWYTQHWSLQYFSLEMLLIPTFCWFWKQKIFEKSVRKRYHRTKKKLPVDFCLNKVRFKFLQRIPVEYCRMCVQILYSIQCCSQNCWKKHTFQNHLPVEFVVNNSHKRSVVEFIQPAWRNVCPKIYIL